MISYLIIVQYNNSSRMIYISIEVMRKKLILSHSNSYYAYALLIPDNFVFDQFDQQQLRI